MDALGLYDIYDYWYQPLWQTMWFKVLLGTGLFLVFVGVFFYVWRTRKAHKQVDPWVAWRTKLTELQKRPVDTTIFYGAVAGVIKECAVLKLKASQSLTDTELTLFLKSGTFPEPVKKLGDVVARAHGYKFDPVCSEPWVKEKELVYITDALECIKKMEQQTKRTN